MFCGWPSYLLDKCLNHDPTGLLAPQEIGLSQGVKTTTASLHETQQRQQKGIKREANTERQPLISHAPLQELRMFDDLTRPVQGKHLMSYFKTCEIRDDISGEGI